MRIKRHVKQVRETVAGKAISAYFITDKAGKQVAYVHEFRSFAKENHMHRVDVFQPGRRDGYSFAQYRGQTLNQALEGADIGGVILHDDCVTSIETEKLLAGYHALSDVMTRQKFALHVSLKLGMEWVDGGRQLYYAPGFKRLEAMGFRVFNVF